MAVVSLPEPAYTVATGMWMSIVITQTGTVYTFGTGKHGELGTGSVKPRQEPMVVQLSERIVSAGGGYTHMVMLSESGQLYGCGNGGLWSIRASG
jgi:alpha-tubulin suppressor-like RCC1 family protein